mmetsp:Transcript_3424/g.5178  ORF Transcript_3424/g.5178 Transcript_3424/m.5178 type:complete len:255 (-) Transcript_3424:1095-1859(-)
MRQASRKRDRLSPDEWLSRMRRKKEEAIFIDTDSSVRWKNLGKRIAYEPSGPSAPKYIVGSILDLGNDYWIRTQQDVPFSPEEVFNIFCTNATHRPWVDNNSYAVILETLLEKKPLLQLTKSVLNRWRPFLCIECLLMTYGDVDSSGVYFHVQSPVDPDMQDSGDTRLVGFLVKRASFELQALLVRQGPQGGATITRITKMSSKLGLFSPLPSSAQMHIIYELFMGIDKRMLLLLMLFLWLLLLFCRCVTVCGT